MCVSMITFIFNKYLDFKDPKKSDPFKIVDYSP